MSEAVTRARGRVTRLYCALGKDAIAESEQARILSLLLQIAFLHLFARILDQSQIDVPATRCFSQVGRKAVRKHAKPCVDSDIRLIGDIGELAGLTTHYPPRTYHSITAESDAALGGITGDAWKHFITRWREAGGDRRRIKGV